MLDVLRFLTRRSLLGIADFAVTMPLTRWTWTGLAEGSVVDTLSEFRPADPESVRDMMAGRYLLASHLVDTGGVSPFAVDVDSPDWWQNLHSFAWLRHFKDTRDGGERGFARTLVLDWIGREGRFDRQTWAPGLTAQRVLSWLRHYSLITDGATPEQVATLRRALGSQLAALRNRAGFCVQPLDAMLTAIALVGAGICTGLDDDELGKRVEKLLKLLGEQLDENGLYRSRSGKVQLQLLTELVTVKKALSRKHGILARELNTRIEAMHRALDAITLGGGEPAYFHGTGQLPHDLLVAVQAQSLTRGRETGLVSGYGVLVDHEGVVVADGGLVPPLAFADDAHASALAFEYSHGAELVVGSCGPAPSALAASRDLFRQTSAHTAPTIDGLSSDAVVERGGLRGRIRPFGTYSAPLVDAEEKTLLLTTDGFKGRTGVVLERRLTLLADGRTLVGQDKITLAGKPQPGEHRAIIRFHLAPGAKVRTGNNQDLIRIQQVSGRSWTFLWEGAELHEEESVRQSAHFGFHRTRQIVLEAPVADGKEIAWIFTLDQ